MPPGNGADQGSLDEFSATKVDRSQTGSEICNRLSYIHNFDLILSRCLLSKIQSLPWNFGAVDWRNLWNAAIVGSI